MEALFEAARGTVAAFAQSAKESAVYKEELNKLKRFVSKVSLLMAELELQLQIEQPLRGSESMFLGAEAVLDSLKQAEALARQCKSSSAAIIWPLEDAVEFQSVALEMRNAVSQLGSMEISLPEDVREDVRHFQRQLHFLQFTEKELEDSAVEEFTAEQINNKEARKKQEMKMENAAQEEAGGEKNKLPASAAALPLLSEVEVDETWEGGADKESPDDEEEKEEEEEEENKIEDFIPPVDKEITRLLDEQGVAYVNLDDDEKGPSALPPGSPVKGALTVNNGEPLEGLHLPEDPFDLEEEK